MRQNFFDSLDDLKRSLIIVVGLITFGMGSADAVKPEFLPIDDASTMMFYGGGLVGTGAMMRRSKKERDRAPRN